MQHSLSKTTKEDEIGEEKSLFQRNFIFFEARMPRYATLLKSMRTSAAIPIFDDGTRGSGNLLELEAEIAENNRKIVNIDIGNRLLYEDDVSQIVLKQIEDFNKEPDRTMVGYSSLTHETLRSNQALERIKKKGNKAFSNMPISNEFKSEVVVGLGLGLGYHLKDMIEKFDVRILLIVEGYHEFLYFSLFCIDWEEIFQLIDDKNGSISIYCDKTEHIQDVIVQALREIGIGQIDGLLFFKHYASAGLLKLRNNILNNMSFICSNLGFTEDEIIMLVNSLQNFEQTNPAYYWYSKARLEKQTPVFIVGSAPSIDYSIETLKAIQDQVIIISCGTALRVLLANGIKPDFHTLIENTLDQEKTISWLCEEFDLSDITILASISVPHKAIKAFGKKILFFRDHLAIEPLYAPQCTTINYAGPMVSNLGLRFAIGLGFRNIYLLGIDLGSRDEARHHSKYSPYNTHKELIGNQPDFSHKGLSKQAKRDKLLTSRSANFGGLVISNMVYDITLIFKTSLIKNYPDINFYNCSDGVRIEGFTPILLEVAAQEFPAARMSKDGITKHDVMQSFRELELIEDGKEAYAKSFRQTRRRVKRYCDSLIKKIAPYDDFSDLTRFLYYELMKDHQEKDISFMRRVLRGTIFIEVSGLHFFYRRTKSANFDEFFTWGKKLLCHEITEIGEHVCEVMKLYEAGRISELRADAYAKEGFLHGYLEKKSLDEIE